MRRSRFLGGLALLVAAAGCGGGGGGFLGGGIGGTGITTSGPIAKIETKAKAVSRRITVNGVEYDTAGATVTLDDNPGGADDLRVGQYVTVRGRLDDGGVTGRADDVAFDDEVQGPVASLNVGAGTLVVLGRTVRTDASTVIRESGTDAALTFAQLAVGNIVEASGVVNAQGEILATRIERKSTVFEPGESEFEVKGTISAFDAAAKTFTLTSGAGVFTVNFSGAETRGVLGNGVFVEVKTESPVVGGAIAATRVKVEDDGGPGEPGEEREIKGFVTRFASLADFDVDGAPVATTAFTEFRDGTAAQLGLNDLVEVEGVVNNLGVLVARKVKFEDEAGDDGTEDERKVQGAITRFTSAASFAVGAQEIVTTAATEFDDGTAADLGLGVVVEVEGVLNQDDVLVAKKVKIEDKRGPGGSGAAPGGGPGAGVGEDRSQHANGDDRGVLDDDSSDHDSGDDQGVTDDDPADHDAGDDQGMTEDDPADHDSGDDPGTVDDDPSDHDAGDDQGVTEDDPADHDSGDDR